MGNSTSSRVKPGSTDKIGRKAVRSILRIIGRILLFMLARVTIAGKQNFPKTGPLILAGNHVGVMEVMMMAVYPPYNLEFIGSGDIPLDPTFAWLARLWGFIPVNRGNLDRKAILRGVEILKNKGTVVVFPEGGIWNPGEMKARSGIALLSGLSKSPVLPIGFGGVQGSLKAALRFRRPALEMNIGGLIPSVNLDEPGLSKKQALELGSELIWSNIIQLIPGGDSPAALKISDENHNLYIRLYTDEHGETGEESGHGISKSQALARFLLHPVIMDIFNRNLKLPVDALMNNSIEDDPDKIRSACEMVLNYLEDNPGFLTYRFGMQEGLDMQKGVQELHELAQIASAEGLRLSVQPERTYIDLETGEQVVENSPGSPNQY